MNDMKNQLIDKVYVWTDGDQSVGIAGESAEVSADGWLIDSDHYGSEDFSDVIEEFREKVRAAFETIWSGEKVYVAYDFELKDGDPQ